MRKLDVIKELEAIAGNPVVKIWDHLKCANQCSGEDSAEGLYDLEVSVLNDDLDAGEKEYLKEVHDIEDPQPIIVFGFDNPDEEYADQEFRQRNIIELEEKRMAWAKEMFPTATALSSLIKMKSEIDEVEIELLKLVLCKTTEVHELQTKKVLKEGVDVLMCLFDSMGRASINPEMLFEGFAEKLQINMNRKWKDNGDGTYSHVKEENQLVLTGENGEAVVIEKQVITKSHNHDHYFIQDGILYEWYRTIRGKRVRGLIEVDLPNCNRLSEEEINSIKEKLKTEK